ncbi:hypothetical protein GCM10022220_69640 [Actinocatenispora rupis]|uniref:Uncharacterized protein n=1 Tax=Actinocatenispora rupis TaxID=519421 RepID=A0A8J3NA39_9ACTN|nr:hypothetical protein Aru02nite_00160 [Actinocatenispora rupis]
MQAGRDGAAGVPGDEGADPFAGGDRVPGVHPRPDRLVRGAQPVGMVDADHADSGDRAGEHDGAGAGGEHGFPWRTGEVDATVTGQPAFRRWVEPAHHPRRAGQWPAVAGVRAGGRFRRGLGAAVRGATGDGDSRGGDGHARGGGDGDPDRPASGGWLRADQAGPSRRTRW